MQAGQLSVQHSLGPWQIRSTRLLRSPPAAPAARGRRLVAVCAQSDLLADKEADRERPGDIVAMARRRTAVQQAAAAEQNNSGLGDFVRKLRAAWLIFFPERPRPLSPKEEGKRRLRMILVADRCGMSQESLANMRQNIVRVVAEYVDIEAEDLVEVSMRPLTAAVPPAWEAQLPGWHASARVNLSMDPELGTIYSVAVPVKRVKPQARLPLDTDLDTDGITLTWDPNDHDSDPSSQFPYGA